MERGIIIKNENGYYQVQNESGQIFQCRVRGRIKKERYSLLVGDKVQFTAISNKEGTIETIEERHNFLIRPAVANLDQVVLVMAAHNPDINEQLLNKLLVAIENKQIPIVLCINKWDLKDEYSEDVKQLYEQVGYTVLTASAEKKQGIDDLRRALEGKVTAFAGPSGVGKSSLLNAIEPNFAFQTGDLSSKIKRGRHTTRHASLYSLNTHSFIMDTPGFSAIDISNIKPASLGYCFPEFISHMKDCRFNSCIHEHEPVCGIKKAVEMNLINKNRYNSYLSILVEIKNTQRKR